MNAKLAKEVRARLLADTSMGAHTRRERAEETSVQQAGHLLRAHPWQDADTLSLASHEMLLSIIWRYDLDAPIGLQPQRECKHPTCQYCGPPVPKLRDTADRIELALSAKRDWLAHAVRSCKWNNGVRRLCHDAILKHLVDCGRHNQFFLIVSDRSRDECT